MIDFDLRYQNAIQSLIEPLNNAWLVKKEETVHVRWYYIERQGRNLPSQGWKIHVSAAPTEAVDLCERVVSFLLAKEATFKIAGDKEVLSSSDTGSIQQAQF